MTPELGDRVEVEECEEPRPNVKLHVCIIREIIALVNEKNIAATAAAFCRVICAEKFELAAVRKCVNRIRLIPPLIIETFAHDIFKITQTTAFEMRDRFGDDGNDDDSFCVFGNENEELDDRERLR